MIQKSITFLEASGRVRIALGRRCLRIGNALLFGIAAPHFETPLPLAFTCRSPHICSYHEPLKTVWISRSLSRLGPGAPHPMNRRDGTSAERRAFDLKPPSSASVHPLRFKKSAPFHLPRHALSCSPLLKTARGSPGRHRTGARRRRWAGQGGDSHRSRVCGRSFRRSRRACRAHRSHRRLRGRWRR